ncbi:MAG: reverse transcriptase family protein [Rhizobiaceae bacterium]|nr:reverse transcriptase family protein [Rhizobiaceae bacterium]
MEQRELAKNLAHSIVDGPWNASYIGFRLGQRLPNAVQQHGADIAKELTASIPKIYAPTPQRVVEFLLESEPFFKIYTYCVEKNVWPNPDISAGKMNPIPAFNRLDIPQLPTRQSLAEWFGLPDSDLDYLADETMRHSRSEVQRINHYYHKVLDKRSGSIRLIEAPKQQLKSLQREILNELLNLIPVHENAFGFVAGRNCLDAAQRHCGEEVIIRFDLKDFFPSIQYGRIFGLFRCLGYPQPVARCLAGLCTLSTPGNVLRQLPSDLRPLYRKVHLPQGAPTSPAIANLVVYSMDLRLAGLAHSVGANYTRYADDLTFSGNSEIVPGVINSVPEIVVSEGLVLNDAKTRVMPKTARQTVTGVVVNNHLNIRRCDYDRLKAVLHACQKAEDVRLLDEEFRASLSGKIAWVERVNLRRGKKLRAKFDFACAQTMKLDAS